MRPTSPMFHRFGVPVGAGLARRMSHLSLLVALVNAPFWILSSYSFVSRGLINLDSLLALLILQYSATLGIAAVVIAWAGDLGTTASFGYHFASPLDFFRSAGFAGNINWADYLQQQPVAAALPFIVGLTVLWRLRSRPVGVFPIVVAIALLILVDAINGSSAASRRDVRRLPVNIAGSAFYGMARALVDDEKASLLVDVAPGTGGIPEFEHFVPSAISSGHSIVYVIVESLGLHKKAAVRNWLQRQIFPEALANSYDLSVGTAPAFGGTTSGELRRLCGQQGSYRLLTPQTGATCLPQTLQKSGWHTVGLHGFSSEMFDRRHWWPFIGIEDARFAEQLRLEVPRQCGAAFRGVCDEDLLAAAVRAADRPRTFVYALTLNSHLPLAPIEVPDDLARICAETASGPDVCALLAHQGKALRALSRELAISPNKPFVVLAGDHSPPFFSMQSRIQFEPNSVPVFALSPKIQLILVGRP